MKLQIKIIIIVIPFVLSSLLTLGFWSFNEAKKSIYLSSYRYMRIILDSYTADHLLQNYQLLKDAKMDEVASYVESYKQDGINKAMKIVKTREGYFFIIDESGKRVFHTTGQDHDIGKIPWKNIAKGVVDDGSDKIFEGYYEKNSHNALYVAQYFKPWGWVVIYAIPGKDINTLVNKIRLITFGITILCAFVGSLLILAFCRVYLVAPINKLKDTASRIAAQKRIDTIAIDSKDEIGQLARSMEIMSKGIQQYKNEREYAEKLLINKQEELHKSQAEFKKYSDSLEQLVDKRTYKLKESEKRFRTMIEKSPLPMSITDANQDISYFNDKFTESFGYTIEDVSTAEKWWEIAYPDKEYRTKVQKSWSDAFENATINSTDIEKQEWDLTIKDRTTRRCEFHMVPLGDVSLIVINDITEQKKLNEELIKHREHLEELVEEKTLDLRKMVNMMAGREIRMKELKDIITQLQKQLNEAGM